MSARASASPLPDIPVTNGSVFATAVDGVGNRSKVLRKGFRIIR